MKHKLNNKTKNKIPNLNIKNTRKGFTMIELLAIIVILSIVSVGAFALYNNIIRNTKNNATLAAIDSIKSAAELYSKENTNDIKWIATYESTGTKNGRYVCMTVQQLINAGFFKEDFFEKDIYKSSKINTDTFFEINQNISGAETQVIMHESATNKLMCEMSVNNKNTTNLDISNNLAYTDRISFDINPQDKGIDYGNIYYTCSMNGKDGIVNSNNCSFVGLEDDTVYNDINICINPIEGNDKLTSSFCDTIGSQTSTFKEPKIEVNNSNWSQSRQITIKYDNTNVYKPYHYFKSDVDAIAINSNVYKCTDLQNKECTTETTTIEKNAWYKTTNDEIIINTVKNINIGEKDNSKKITARIQDETGNYIDTKEYIKKLDNTKPICTSSGGSTTWTNKSLTLTGTCKDETGGSGCTKEKITKEFKTTTNTTTASPGKVYDNAGNEGECPGNQTVKIDITAPTCTSSGGSTWTNKNVTVTGTCTDETGGSGCTDASKTITATFTTEQNTSQSPGTVYDKAGNSTKCPTKTVQIDKTPPVCTTSGGGVWTNGSVTLTGTCSDNKGTYNSGCSSATVTKTFSGQQNTTGSPGTVYDKAGNSQACGSAKVMIDTTVPTLTVTMYKRTSTGGKEGSALCTKTANSTDNTVSLSGCSATKVNGWYNKANYPYGVYFAISASDTGGSGVGTKKWNYNNGGFPKDTGGNDYTKDTDNSKYDASKRTYNTEIKAASDNSAYLSGDGYRLARYTLYDNAGNYSYVNITVPIDKTAPTISCNSTGWNDRCCEDRDDLSYVLKCYYYDGVSGLHSRKYGYCARSSCSNADSAYSSSSYSTETQSRKTFIDVMWYEYSNMRWVYDEWYRTDKSSYYKMKIKDQAGNTSSATSWSGSYKKGTDNSGRCTAWCK